MLDSLRGMQRSILYNTRGRRFCNDYLGLTLPMVLRLDISGGQMLCIRRRTGFQRTQRLEKGAELRLVVSQVECMHLAI